MNINEFQYRQGDVYLYAVDKLPDDLQIVEPINNQNMLAYGEVSGHAHVIKSDDSIFYAANDNLFKLAKKTGLSENRNVVGALRVIVDNTKLWHGTPKKNATEPRDPDHDAINLPVGDYIVCLPREYSDEVEFVRVAD